MKILYIHIGTHKTGTTAFQNILKKNSTKLLRKDGVALIDIEEFPRLKEFKQSDEVDKGLADDLAGFLEQRAVRHKNILSYEGFSGKTTKVVYSNTGVLAKILRDATQSFETKILVFFRRQDEFIQSLFTQKVHQGQSIQIQDFINDLDFKFLDWNNFLNPWIQTFGEENITVFPYDPIVLNEKKVHELLNDVIKSKTLSAIQDVPEKNIGMSKNATQIMKGMSEVLNPDEKKILRRVLQKVDNKGINQEYNILNSEIKSKIIAHFDNSNRLLSTKYYSEKFNMENFSRPFFVTDNDQPIEKSYQKLIKGLIFEVNTNREKSKGSYLFKMLFEKLKSKL